MTEKKTNEDVVEDRELLQEAAGEGQQTTPSSSKDAASKRNWEIDQRLIHWGLIFSRDSRRPNPPQYAEGQEGRDAIADFEARGLDLDTSADVPEKASKKKK